MVPGMEGSGPPHPWVIFQGSSGQRSPSPPLAPLSLLLPPLLPLEPLLLIHAMSIHAIQLLWVPFPLFTRLTGQASLFCLWAVASDLCETRHYLSLSSSGSTLVTCLTSLPSHSPSPSPGSGEIIFFWGEREGSAWILTLHVKLFSEVAAVNSSGVRFLETYFLFCFQHRIIFHP